jgi:thiosulfate dehydrogenase
MGSSENPFERTASYTIGSCILLFFTITCGILWIVLSRDTPAPATDAVAGIPGKPIELVWNAPGVQSIPSTQDGDLIRYGRELVVHTALYLGPMGKRRQISNGMNCQNCHLQGGTKPFGNNYALVASTYPKFRARSGTIETVEKRINDCIERSLNGIQLADTSREMRAIKAYILWVGSDVKKDQSPVGGGLGELPFIHRAADPAKGKIVFEMHCKRCHNSDGRGRRLGREGEWIYPPLAGDSSYNIGAGLFRLSRFAAYVRNNMPEGTTYLNPLLSVEEAWDVAAYINNLPRPTKNISKDWPDISTKPFDHPFGPYTDSFPEAQHKFGPFAAIRDTKKKK